MASCTFFGHRKIHGETALKIRDILIDLITNQNVDVFYVGNTGEFDKTVISELDYLSKIYSFSYFVVLAYMPTSKDNYFYKSSVLPEGIEKVPRRFAIVYRNKWMIKQSDYVVTYVENTVGSNSAKFKELSKKQGKFVIEISA